MTVQQVTASLTAPGQRLVRTVRLRLVDRPAQNFAALDGLRALAVLTIVCFHCALLVGFFGAAPPVSLPLRFIRWFFLGCWIGVDVFFVLSGFLIGRILLGQIRSSGDLSFRAFYVRRTCRIFPAYYLVLTLSTFVFARLNPFKLLYLGTASEAIQRGSWANYLYVSNYVFGRQPNALSWGWSLCVEEHFYLVLPALLWLCVRPARASFQKGFLTVLALSPLLSRAVAFWQNPRLIVLDGPYYQSHAHCDGLLLGVLVAYFYVQRREQFSGLVRCAGPFIWVAGAVCLASVFLWGGLEERGLFPVVLQFSIVALGCGLLLVNGLFLENRASRFLAHRYWYPLARLSYGIYLLHPFALVGILYLWPGGQAAVTGSVLSVVSFTLLVTVLAVACASVLFLVIEHPFLERGARLSRRLTATS